LSGRRFVPALADALPRCGWIGVLNDVELAAHDVALQDDRVLFLSLGYGPGAALVTCLQRTSLP
jgi:hypothetical protein